MRWLFGVGIPGPGGLKSTAFSLRRQTDPRAAYVFEGRGHGHGLGMCQWGAEARARQGATAGDILRAYYAGTEILRAP
jgi:stage II sporulation protein D